MPKPRLGLDRTSSTIYHGTKDAHVNDEEVGERWVPIPGKQLERDITRTGRA